MTALMHSSFKGHVDIASILIEKGCDMDVQDKVNIMLTFLNYVDLNLNQLALFLFK